MKNTLLIIGAGASGLIASIIASRLGSKVTLLEQNTKIGKKILVSGNGQCNIDNSHLSLARFHGENTAFIEEVLEGYTIKDIKKFFHSIGLELIEGKEAKLFPLSLQASSVVELLEYEAKALGVQIFCEQEVTNIQKSKQGFEVKSTEKVFTAEKLLLSTGSPASPQLGGSNVGYALAQSLGHTLITPHPALVQLCSDEAWVKDASGVKIAGTATFYANGEYISEKKGDLLFSNYGISGLAILDLSREVSLALADYAYCELSLDLMPQMSKEQLTSLLLKRITPQSQKPLRLWLQGVIHKKLIHEIIKQSKSKIKEEKALNRKEINRLVHTIKNLKLSISDTKGFKSAEVATGGIDTKEVNPQTMQSKKIKNLYFAGEILDGDGDRGGFNFHFAWVSGMRAGKNISNSNIEIIKIPTHKGYK